jgi:penicillin-binding protein 2
MKFWRIAMLLVIITTGCNAATGSTPPQPVLSTNQPLPTPVVYTTRVPDPESAAKVFLDSWKAEDYPKMYSLLTPISKDAISLEDFNKKYTDTAINMSLQTIDYSVISTLTNPTNSQVAFRVTYHTVLLGDLDRDITISLDQDKGYWLVQWEDGLILPELKGGNHLSLDYKIPARGNIYDRNEKAIAALTDAVALGVVPAAILPEAKDSVTSILNRLTGIPAPWISSIVQGQENYYVNVGETTADKYNEFAGALAQFSGVDVTPYNTRFYYDGGIAPQTIGYVQQVPAEELDAYRRMGYLGDEKVGVSGLEKWGEEYLAGKHGGNLYVIDPQGQIVTRLASAEPSASQSIYTTLDKDLQIGAQNALAGFAGAAVVLERDTGRVLAIVSSPGYDSNLFDPYNANFQFLGSMLSDPNQPLLNRATQGQYPLGSVFKIITMAAALESKQFKKDTPYNCTSQFTELAGITLDDWTFTKGFPASGMLDLQGGLMRSCNPWFWHIGLNLYQIGLTTTVTDMARGFGLGTETGIGQIAEDTGNVPDAASEGDAVQLAIGQGELLVTPLQVAHFIAAVGNGGTLYRPQIIEKITPPNGDPTLVFKPEVQSKLPISAENLKAIQEAMYMVVENNRGTAYRTFVGMGIPIYGKTGTAQANPGEDPHAWFAGYTDARNPGKPDIAVVVLVQNQGEGSEWAAPIFRRIVELYFTGQISRRYPWESNYYITATPTSPLDPTIEVTKTPKKKK